METPSTANHYQSLGVPPQADQSMIRRAYQRLARRFHPDLNGQAPAAQQQMAQLNEAYQVLSDPRRRAAYDALRAAVRAPFSPFARGKARRGVDAHARLAIALADAYAGALRDVSVQPPDAAHPRLVQVAIPRGVRAGQKLRLVGQGGAGANGGAPGDLFLEIEFKPDPRFGLVEGSADVHGTLPLAPWEAALGGEIEVDTPDGQTVFVTVAPNSPPGRTLRLTGLGLPGGDGGTPGDLLLTLEIAWPPADDATAQALWLAMGKALADFNPRA